MGISLGAYREPVVQLDYIGNIENTFLGFTENKQLTFYLKLNLTCVFSDGSKSNHVHTPTIGHSVLGEYTYKNEFYVSFPFTSELIMNILSTVGVSSWEELKGSEIRARDFDWDFWIGHKTEDKWFNIGEFYCNRNLHNVSTAKYFVDRYNDELYKKLCLEKESCRDCPFNDKKDELHTVCNKDLLEYRCKMLYSTTGDEIDV